ncbi:hypothetical protein EJ04DRAFT_514972 [Polyplosphaeria fusca]|uniref:Uncharacterized protein n=1 Tax=Polyplosphaeria fusca TaxID=682080 RepID=A0A9P4UZB4_9PLEO|nr:hypothetical protein EJ04DRAFT_514972 [Polyplosphaeria fusca]
MLTSTILLSAVAAIAAAMPASQPIEARAGGPVAKPIPSSCTVSSPLPTSSSATYLPDTSKTSNALVYYAYYDLPADNPEQLYQQCLEQCYGLGVNPPCVAAYWAQQMVVPAGYYGGAGGNLDMACLMYNRTLTAADFVQAPSGQAVTPMAGDIHCPA